MPAHSTPADETKRPRILVVDDDASMLILLPKILVRKGFDVSVAGDADAAEKALERDEFDAVVVDLQMPGRDGFSLAGVVRQRWPGTKIIFVSAYDSDAMRKKAALLGVEAFLAKPVGVEELIQHLKSSKAANG